MMDNEKGYVEKSYVSREVHPMIPKAIQNANSHGIKVYHDKPNNADGNCFF